MRRGYALLAVGATFGVVAVLLSAATTRRPVAFSVGLPAVRVVGTAEPGGGEVCRERIDVPVAFASVQLLVATFGRRGSGLTITVTDAGSGRPLGRGRVAGGFPDNTLVTAAVGEVPAGGQVRLCVRNTGTVPVALRGASRDTIADELADPGLRAEPAVVFRRAEAVSVLSQVPDAFARAARFKASGLGPWTFWLLLAGVGIGLPLLLAGALRAVQTSERS